MRAMQRWDIFCRVIDNHGDVGVCWRLSHALAQRGVRVRLWIDDASALAWMAPEGHPGVQLVPFNDAALAADVGSVVIESFGCELPAGFLNRMRQATSPPVWINLEYLSAQAYVERSHGLMSPQASGPAKGLPKWFFYPGFTAGTGGLMRPTQDAHAWPATFDRRAGERVVSVFAYGEADLAWLVQALACEPTVLVAAQGPSLVAIQSILREAGNTLPFLRLHELGWIPQRQFDRWLALCDLNVVRGEDSLVSAVWAGKPFLWNIYPQQDSAHHEKLEALLDRMLGRETSPITNSLRGAWRRLNRVPTSDVPLHLDADALKAWSTAIAPWQRQLQGLPDLVTELMAFAKAHRSPGPSERAADPG